MDGSDEARLLGQRARMAAVELRDRLPATKREGRTPLFTRDVLQAIPLWLEMGASVPEIVEALGTTEGSLRVTCSKYGISLRAPASLLRRALSPEQMRVLQHEAARRGVPVWQLMADVVAAVANSRRFSEILDATRQQ